MDTHLYKLCDLTQKYNLDKVYIHALTDGRDTDPNSGKGYVKNLLKHLKVSNGQIASLTGRYYTMDRDNRWERVKKGYDAMVYGKGKKSTISPFAKFRQIKSVSCLFISSTIASFT